MDEIKWPDWMHGLNVYEVNVRQYTPEGTFNAFEKHLPRLKDMGVKILWFMPVTPISKEKMQGNLGSYYAASSYTEINPEFGTLDEFKQLVELVHNMGMKVIIDWVANHTGYDHWWTKEHPDWYEKDDAGNFVEKHGWADVIDLDYTNKDMRAEMIKSMQYWIKECDIDGFRCDMAHLVPLDFWVKAKEECIKIKLLFWLAECEVPEYHKVFFATYAWKWMHVSESLAKGYASLQNTRDVLKAYSEYPAGACKLYFTSNHDENSWNGTEYEKYGNAAKTFAVFCFTWPGLPLVYSGQELPNLKRLAFFDKDVIEWTNHLPALHDFYNKLMTLKSTNAALEYNAAFEILATGYNDDIFAFLRTGYNNSKVLVILNLSNSDKLQFRLSHSGIEGNYTNLFSSLLYKIEANQHFEMQAWEFIVLSSI